MAEVRQLNLKRGSLKRKLTLFKKYLDEIIAKSQLIDDDYRTLKLRLDKIIPLYDEFEEVQNEINLTTDDEIQDTLDREEFQNCYFSLVSLAEGILLENASENHTLRSHTSAMIANPILNNIPPYRNIKLPTINLPSFDGTFTRWREFYDAFNSIIHSDQQLTKSQKLSYLRLSLKDEPLGLVRSLETTESNYEIAWSLLQKRYNNTRRIINNHVQNLLDIQPIIRESHVALREIINVVENNIQCLKSLKQPVDSWDALLLPIITSKLDVNTIKEWESKLNNKSNNLDTIPSLNEFLDFLNNRQNMLESIQRKSIEPVKHNTNSGTRTIKTFTTTNMSNVTQTLCPICKESHMIYSCPEYLNLNVEGRTAKIKQLKLCLNCLRQGHFGSNCLSKSTCKECKRKHHTTIHSNNFKLSSSSGQQSQSLQPVPIETVNHHYASSIQTSYVLLATAKAQVADSNNQFHELRVLLDSASQSNFISEAACKLLKLKQRPISVNVIGLAGKSEITHRVGVLLKSLCNEFTTELSCLVIPQITQTLPSQFIDIETINIPSNIKLSDPAFGQPQEIDLLIGAELFYSLLCVGQIKLLTGPILQKTKLGWVIAGPLQFENPAVSRQSFLSLEEQVARLWQIDEFQLNNKTLTDEELFCEQHFKDTTTRCADGKFVVRIPWKENVNKLGNSYDIAKQRFLKSESRLHKDNNLREQYSNFIHEYVQLKHMTQVTPDEKLSFFLPHHPVLKSSSETTKLRVVFDGSCEPEIGVSVNKLQCTGPTIQHDLFSILSRFRTYQYVITADITKMYRQVWIHPNDRQYQRILWRDTPNEELQWYELNTVTYGTTAAPFLAIRSLFEIGILNVNKFPTESKIIREDFYVDDLLTGSNSIEEIITIKTNIEKMLIQYGFILRKWTTNLRECDSTSHDFVQLGEKTHKILGIQWNPSTDAFSFSTNISTNSRITKRFVLSLTAQLYDPLGLVAPTVVIAKLIIKQLWQLNLGWDESLPLDLQTTWFRFIDNLKHINEIEIPRHILINDPNEVEIHTFCDASERAYGACIYIRSTNGITYFAKLLAAKSRVAPSKTVLIPRLELCAAVLAVQLTDKFKKILRLKISREYFWSDSQITICWINSAPNKWKTFIANRIAEIQSLTNARNWYHVKSSDNPADIVSRGMFPNQLKMSKLWWNGPEWLTKPQSDWPSVIVNDMSSMDKIHEECKTTHSFIINIENSFPIENFSSFMKLKRVTAYCLRFNHNCLNKRENRLFGSLSNDELHNALIKLVKLVQMKSFPNELNLLIRNKPLHSTSNLLSLSPFADTQGVLRVGGRLQQSNFNYDKRHPMLLPTNDHFTLILIRDLHKRLLHAGQRLLLSVVREQFWPISGKNLVKKIVRQCVQCHRFNAKPAIPIMGALPAQRTCKTLPFHTTGVDYAGPFLLKDRLGRGAKIIKGYICLFVCFSTKAIHLELVTSLTTENFIACLRRFIARRGKPLNIFSDNGTNFIGAHTEIMNLTEFLKNNSDSIKTITSNEGINWHFIPPRAPHFGGLWEAGIKSVKYHLKRVLNNITFTYEDFNTIIIQIESILNSRPLCSLTDDPNDVEVLTPAHFLIGRSYTSIPDPNVCDIATNRLSRFQHLQKIIQHFWNKWHKVYIHELQQHYKWKTSNSPLREGIIVLMKEDNLPPSKWQLGRVIKLHAGLDHQVRVVTIKGASGEFKRPVSKICALPIV